ncbi:unnamed protein product [Rhizoctonia solani]|uniref:Uncharacterized protein n=1 Tax=Rhizoctonia solani TaxID=456999 RepID=A0A8H3C8D4_9AGAM|nr:unnamed protein product [Rhizoctonia solani]
MQIREKGNGSRDDAEYARVCTNGKQSSPHPLKALYVHVLTTTGLGIMSIDSSTLSLRAWVVDSRRRPLPIFNLRRIAPDMIECWHLSVVGEIFSIYFNGCEQSAEQKSLDIHAVAELDGRIKLDGVVLTSAQRADGHVGGIVDQPVGKEMARSLKFGRLHLTEWLASHTKFLPSREPRFGASSLHEHLLPSQRPEDLRIGGTNDPPNLLGQTGPKQRSLRREDGQTLAAQVKLNPDDRIDVTPGVLGGPDTSGDKLSGFNIRKRRKRQPSLQVFCKPKDEEDNKDAVVHRGHMGRSGGTSNEPIIIISGSESEGSSDECVITHTNENKKKKHTSTLKEGNVKKRLKSEEYTGVVSTTKVPNYRWDDKHVKIKTEPIE